MYKPTKEYRLGYMQVLTNEDRKRIYNDGITITSGLLSPNEYNYKCKSDVRLLHQLDGVDKGSSGQEQVSLESCVSSIKDNYKREDFFLSLFYAPKSLKDRGVTYTANQGRRV